MNPVSFVPSFSASVSTSSSPPSVHRLRAWSAAQQAQLRTMLATLLRDWQNDWLPSAGDGRNQDVSDDDISLEGAGASADALAWGWCFETHERATAPAAAALAQRIAQQARQALAARLFETARTTPMSPFSAAVVQQAWDGWMQRLAQLAQMAPRGGEGEGTDDAASLASVRTDLLEKPAPGSHWRGHLRASWAWCGGRWHVFLPWSLLEQRLRPPHDAQTPSSVSPAAAHARPAIHPLEQALAGQSIALAVHLPAVELTLGQLADLRSGDLVTLNHPLDAALQVRAPDGTPICGGWLGQRQGRMAVSLVSVSATTAP